jgi:hypothetical protein
MMNNNKKRSFKKAYESTDESVWLRYVRKHELTVDQTMDLIREIYGQVYIDDLINNTSQTKN